MTELPLLANKKFFFLEEFYIAKFATYVPKLATYIPKFATYVPKFAMKVSLGSCGLGDTQAMEEEICNKI